ncbi:aspartate carbamoyltransferase [Plasmopara halstedii]|uniref:aspartate carbamoyltransferase n=1 Tax=Plasmopara halstedii TaxID=4781 RepID=A0A0N7L525_PLAHL|nr:aspartate carbamoyltransferase [Plasmopara halstedii]CEG40291.1 aspartate carbamoyltransferase [Plasmopara halstedii]|eukprot:XP_024576660.1 aspartate carbamoyltransferase [Plasmopara halstedii]
MAHKLDGKTAVGAWEGESILSVVQFGKDSAQRVLSVADEMKTMVKTQGANDLLNGKLLANVFMEPSTRTSSSFQAAMLRLGGRVVCVNESSSSSQKGETLHDTIRCLECYADVVVLRHPVKGSALIAAEATKKPVLNAGDGVGEHPTQALLDLYTIYSEFGDLESLKGKVITMVGDLKNGRTVHSLSKLLAMYGPKFNYVSPESLKMPRYVYDELQSQCIKQNETTDLDSVIHETDVLYVTRVQKERFDDEEDYIAVKDSFRITLDVIKDAKSEMIIMHPLPRVGEIAEEVDKDPRAAYFRQMENGMYVRMALLALVLGKA